MSAKLPPALLALASSTALAGSFCELSRIQPSSLELALHLWTSGNAWHERRFPKPGGGERVILAPASPLKDVSRGILKHVVQGFRVHRAVHGCHPGTSVLTNARRHAKFAGSLFTFDLRNAFPSTTEKRVRAVLFEQFVRAAEDGVDASPTEAGELAEAMVAFCLVGKRLPQGFPTSPGILNAVLYPPDRDIGRLLKEETQKTGAAFRFTRYVDDITVSSDAKEIPAELRKRIVAVLGQHGWTVHPKKTRYMGESTKGEDPDRRTGALRVTGLVIHPDGRVTIPRTKLERWQGFLWKVASMEMPSEEDRSRASGIVGYVGMVYDGAVPASIRKAYAAAKARFGGSSRSHEGISGEMDPISGIGEEE